MRREKLLPYLFIAPAGAVLLVFWIWPLFHALSLSFRAHDGGFVGLANYRMILTDGDFWPSLRISVWYLVGTVPAALLISFLIANLLFQKLRALGLFRTIYFLPYITSTVAAAMVWRWIFSPHTGGVANTVLDWLGIAPQRWYYESTGVFELIGYGLGLDLPAWAAGPSLALVCAMVFAIWHTLGFDIVIFLAALSQVPSEVYEAADIDGASGPRRMWSITLPLVAPALLFLSIISIIRSFQTFNEIYIMTQEESMNSTQNLAMLIFNHFYGTFNFGAATAVAVLLFAILLVLTACQMKLSGSKAQP